MADSDSFVQEVTEEVRRDAMYAAWRKYGPFIIGGIALVVVGTAAQSWWKNSQQDAVREAGGAFIAAQNIEEPADSAEVFLNLANESDGDYAAMASLRAAAAFGASGDVDRAVEQYQVVASMSGVDSRLTDLAKLRMIMIRADLMDPAEMLEGLEPLSRAGAPWRSLAMEFMAAAHVRADDNAAAIEVFNTLATDEITTPAVKARSREMIAALGGEIPEVTPPVEQASEDDEDSEEDSQ